MNKNSTKTLNKIIFNKTISIHTQMDDSCFLSKKKVRENAFFVDFLFPPFFSCSQYCFPLLVLLLIYSVQKAWCPKTSDLGIIGN